LISFAIVSSSVSGQYVSTRSCSSVNSTSFDGIAASATPFGSKPRALKLYVSGISSTRGNRAEALNAYEQLRHLLRDELGTAPSQATQDLRRRLLG
jgi:hypothetical protein